ncbi:extracellular solute-binding protein [Lyngbya aestuarii]|uniref:extracellular solute-binding protein n=1 Tax=Lyngbya aestuarii TaxID=118322 RepID=UPI00403DBD22
MIKRRSFLLGASALTLAQLASGCSPGSQVSLRVLVLQDSLPVQLLDEFRKQSKQKITLDFAPEKQLQDLFSRLEIWKEQGHEPGVKPRFSLPWARSKTPVIADLVTLGDYWLAKAIREQLIEPLNPDKLTQWKHLPPLWKNLVKRNSEGELKPDKEGVIWGAPYRWGSTVIAYRRDQFEAEGWKLPSDWSDLWNPELRRRISLLDQPREVIGLTLKTLKESYNTQDLDQVASLEEKLLALHKQVKFYSSDNYLEPLLLGDTSVAVGWSTDIAPFLPHDRRISAVVPRSGTALWADLWVKPAEAANSSAAEIEHQWIDFCWKPQQAREISLLSMAASPMFPEFNPGEIERLLVPRGDVLENSEFLEPLPPSTVEQYQQLWLKIRHCTSYSPGTCKLS